MPKGSPTVPKPLMRQNDRVTCSGNAIKTNERVETCSCSMENPLKTKRHKPSRAQRAQAVARRSKNTGACVWLPLLMAQSILQDLCSIPLSHHLDPPAHHIPLYSPPRSQCFTPTTANSALLT